MQAPVETQTLKHLVMVHLRPAGFGSFQAHTPQPKRRPGASRVEVERSNFTREMSPRLLSNSTGASACSGRGLLPTVRQAIKPSRLYIQVGTSQVRILFQYESADRDHNPQFALISGNPTSTFDTNAAASCKTHIYTTNKFGIDWEARETKTWSKSLQGGSLMRASAGRPTAKRLPRTWIAMDFAPTRVCVNICGT